MHATPYLIERNMSQVFIPLNQGHQVTALTSQCVRGGKNDGRTDGQSGDYMLS